MCTRLLLVMALVVGGCGGSAADGLSGDGSTAGAAPSAAPNAPSTSGGAGASSSSGSSSPGSSSGGTTGGASVGELPLASKLPDACASSQIIRIERPVSISDPSLGHFSYGFSYKPPLVPKSPVIVYVPGGPGMTSIDSAPTDLPVGDGYILTDPRGVGCNALATPLAASVESVFYTSEEFAADVIAAIQSLALDDYVIYGLSYGSMLATLIAHDTEAQNLPPPRAVVLEGVMGRAFGTDSLDSGFIDAWNVIKPTLPTDVVKTFDTQASPFGISATNWSLSLSLLLMGGPNIVTPLLSGLTAGDPLRGSELSEIESAATTPLVDANGAELFKWVSCREISTQMAEDHLDFELTNGALVENTADQGTLCGPLKLTTPYDAATLQFSAKLYYFIGENDPATPPWQGQYHFDHHQGSATRVITKGGGHLSLQLNQAVCAAGVMASIASGGSDFKNALASCGPVTIDEK